MYSQREAFKRWDRFKILYLDNLTILKKIKIKLNYKIQHYRQSTLSTYHVYKKNT